jgi:hypothetical protein
MGNLASTQLNINSDPAVVQSQILRQREQGFQQIQNPFQQAGARLGALLGGGIANLANDRGFFEVSDPLLTKVTQIQGVYNQVAQQIDPASNPEQFYTALSAAYRDAGMGQQALLSMQEAQKAKKEGITTRATELALYEKNPEILTTELQNLAPRIEAGDQQALQRYTELSNLLVRATNKQNLEEESKRSDIDYKRALGSKAGQENVQLQPLMNAAGMRIGTEVYENGVLKGSIVGGVFRPAGQAPAKPTGTAAPATSGGRPMTGTRDWNKAYDNN